MGQQLSEKHKTTDAQFFLGQILENVGKNQAAWCFDTNIDILLTDSFFNSAIFLSDVGQDNWFEDWILEFLL